MPPPLPQDPDKQPAGGGRGRAGSLQDLKWQVGQVRAGREVCARAWGWGGWAATLPEPASLLPFQGEPPGWSQHAPGGQGNNSEERMQRQKTLRILPYLSTDWTQTPWPAPSPHPKLSQPLLKSSPDKRPHFWFSSSNQSHSPWAPSNPALLTIHSPVRVLEGPHASRSPTSSLRYPGNPGPHPAQMPSPGQLPRATPGPQMQPRACTHARTHAPRHPIPNRRSGPGSGSLPLTFPAPAHVQKTKKKKEGSNFSKKQDLERQETWIPIPALPELAV